MGFLAFIKNCFVKKNMSTHSQLYEKTPNRNSQPIFIWKTIELCQIFH